jgi:N,N-dimethylformamidase
MLIGYVSDERYVALCDVALEFVNDAGESWEAWSRATGAVHVDLPPGTYTVTLQKAGYGAKRSRVTIPLTQPHQFRLLSDGLAGYVWPKSVRSGELGEFRVHAVEQYHLELWHYGWTPTFVRALGWFDEHGPRAVMQITPDGDYTQTGVEWNRVGYASPAHKQFVTAPELSGLYYFHARTPSGRQFAFPWIVAPARPEAKLAVLASNITWNAYNNFGGRSNYIHADELPPAPTVNSRTDLKRYNSTEFLTWNCPAYAPLSFERPEPFNHIDSGERITDPIEGRQGCHLAPAEWRLVGWLDKKRIPFDYYAETQLHDGTLDLSAYRVLVTAVHPEYWTRAMYQRVKRWVFEEGGRLVYLGGNGLNCEVEIHGDAMTVRNERITGLDVAGVGGESRLALRLESEAHLLGVVFTPTGIMTGAPYQCLDPEHWCFEGTGLRAGELFGLESLHKRCPGGASGHETDKRSPSSPANTRLLAKGLNPDDGGAEIVHFETPSGGQVFSVGSINWVSSLPVDRDISKITENVLRRLLSQ